MKRLSDFDCSVTAHVEPATVAVLASGSYLAAGEPVVFLGDSGTGKSHLLIGMGVATCEQGHRVRYVTAAQLVNELVEAADERRLSRIVARYGRLDLLCLDELGYVQLDLRGAELLFQIITDPARRAPRWPPPRISPSASGATSSPIRVLSLRSSTRLTFNAHIIETGTESHRLRTTKARPRRK